MSHTYKNTVSLVTGASKGIGYAIAQALVQGGGHVYITARTSSLLHQSAETIDPTAKQVTPVAMDMCDAVAVQSLCDDIQNRFGKLDNLIANAGVLGQMGQAQTIAHDDFKRTMAINVNANHLLITHTHDLLLKSPCPRAVFLSSGAARSMNPNWSAYAASKAALEALVIAYAKENMDTPLRINLVNPGRTRTDMRATAAPDEDPMTLKTPQDILPTFFDLLSPHCTITGQVVNAQ